MACSNMTTKRTSVGIDLGISKSCVSVFQNGKIETIANVWGKPTTASYVAFTDNGCVIGDPARDQMNGSQQNSLFNIKHLIGGNIGKSVEQNLLPYKIVEDDAGMKIQIEQKSVARTIHPEEILALTLGQLKETAELHLHKEVDTAVISVPASYNYNQRQSVKDAGTIAGFNNVFTIIASTASSLAYGFTQREERERNILMIDLGGGSLSVSIVNVDDGIFEVKSVSGDVHLGGEDFINNLVSHFVQEFEEKHGKSIRNDLLAVTRLRPACESAMCKLSSASATMASVEINSLTEDINFCSSVTRDLFEELNAKLFQRILNVVKKAMHNAKVTQSKLDEIVVIGGASHIPKVQTMFKEYFDETNVKMNVNPYQAVACGAAIQAAILCNDKSDSLQDILLVDATPMTLGIEAVHGVMAPIIKRNTNIPIKKCQKFTTFVENPAALVPDCQAELIQKQRQEYEHNCHAHDTSKAPLSQKPLNIQIKIYEGDNVQTSDNNLLCKFTLPNLPHAPSGVPKIAVTFDIPASDSVLHVSAVHENSSTSNTVTVGNCSKFSVEEIKTMRQQINQYLKESDQEISRILSRHKLQRTIDNVKNPGNKELMEKLIVQKVMLQHWLDTHQTAKKEEFESQQKELEEFCKSLTIGS